MQKHIWSAGIFTISFCVYLITLSPDVTFTDAGELAGACASLGVAHPTGYPLFVILGHMWTLLPLPFSVIYKLNLFAAFCTAFSVVLFYHIVKELLFFTAVSLGSKQSAIKAARKRSSAKPIEETKVPASGAGQFDTRVQYVSASTALAYAFAQTVWSQATSIEVYSLHLLFIMLILYLSLTSILRTSLRRMGVAALFLGLSFTNHLTTILLVCPIALLFFYRPVEGFNFSSQRRRQFFGLLLITASCAIVYIYMPFRSSAEPWFNWGAVHRGWEQFSYHALGKQYSVWMFSGEAGAVGKQLKLFFQLIPSNLAFVGSALSLWGIVSLWRHKRSRPLFWFLLLMLLSGVGYSINYNIHDIDSYFLSAFVALLIFMAFGVFDILRRKPKLVFAIFFLPVIALGANWNKCDEHDNLLVREYVKMMVDPLPNNALLVSQQWDYFCSAFWYMQQVEGYRRDIVFIEKELLRRTWYPHQLEKWYPDVIRKSGPEIESYLIDLYNFERDAEIFKIDAKRTTDIQRKFIAMLNSFVSKNIESRPVFATAEVFQGEHGFADAYQKTPFGLSLQLVVKDHPTTFDTSSISTKLFLSSVRRHHSSHLEIGVAETASRSLTSNGLYLLETRKFQEAEWFLQQALLIDPRNTTALEGKSKIQSQLR